MKLFEKVVTKNIESTHRDKYNQAKMESLQYREAINKELSGLIDFIDKGLFLSICRNQTQQSQECKLDGPTIDNAFIEFKIAVSKYCEVILEDSKIKDINKMLTDMEVDVQKNNPSFKEITEKIWHIRFLLSKKTNEKILKEISSYNPTFSPIQISQEETTVSPRCTIS